MNLLMDVHFPDSFPTNPKHKFMASINLPGTPVMEAEEVFSLDKVHLALQSFSNFKAVRPDGIRPIMIRHLGPLALQCDTNIYRASYLLGYVPQSLRKAKVVFILKVGKNDYSDHHSFHPITLFSFLLKGMERILMWHLNATTLLEAPFHDNQHAFHKGRNCEIM